MFISQQLREKSIAEYLLYMWQVEDIIRAYDCSMTRLRREYISQFDYDEDDKEELTDWYGNLVRMMNTEGKRKGTLADKRNNSDGPCRAACQVAQQHEVPFYNAEYYKVLPFIVELRNKGGNKQENEIETCLNALYGVMLLRLQRKDISPDTKHAIDEMTTLIGMLSDYYHKDKTEGLIFDED